MPKTRVILELGTGNDLHGGDYTKAALRAVQDCLHHSSLTMIRSLKVNPKNQTALADLVRSYYQLATDDADLRGYEPRLALQRRIAALEEKLKAKNEVLAELMEEHVALKKSLGEL